MTLNPGQMGLPGSVGQRPHLRVRLHEERLKRPRRAPGAEVYVSQSSPKKNEPNRPSHDARAAMLSDGPDAKRRQLPQEVRGEHVNDALGDDRAVGVPAAPNRREQRRGVLPNVEARVVTDLLEAVEHVLLAILGAKLQPIEHALGMSVVIFDEQVEGAIFDEHTLAVHGGVDEPLGPSDVLFFAQEYAQVVNDDRQAKLQRGLCPFWRSSRPPRTVRATWRRSLCS